MVISPSSYWKLESLEMKHKSIVLSRTSQDSSKIHLVIPSGKLQLFQTKTEFASSMYSWYSTCISHLCSIFWLKPKKRTWLLTGDGTLVRTTSITATLHLIEDFQLIDTRITWDTLTSISNSGTRKSLWSTPTGGAEIKCSESISTWERGTTWSPQCPASIMKKSMPTPRLRTLNGLASALISQCSDLKENLFKH